MKKIGTASYIHHSAYAQLTEEQKEMLKNAIEIFNKDYEKATIYKVDLKNKKVTFIESENFDTAREPVVGNSYTVDLTTQKIKITKAKGQIYHHKWMFVDDNYKGFDIEESKRWSQKWESIIPRDRSIKSRIGYKKYWDEYLREFNLEVED
ncbi:hypothetical protein [Terrisporobacter sp.]|uniref:hypothetical protein n=1 Tax=Terrisporobacter sp. TaxID=1965305 RepID=UPI0039965D52